MNFVHPLLEKSVSIKEGEIVTIVIENPTALRNTVKGITNPNSEFVLSKNFVPIDISKYTELITDMFNIDFETKRFLTKIVAEAEHLGEEYQNETFSLICAINNYAEMIAEKFEYPIKFLPVENIDKLIKLFNYTPDCENTQFAESLIVYMELCRNLLGKQFFVFLNLKSFLSDDEFKLFCKNAEYEKFRVMLIEAFDCDRTWEYEKKIIIDNDLCVVSDGNI